MARRLKNRFLLTLIAGAALAACAQHNSTDLKAPPGGLADDAPLGDNTVGSGQLALEAPAPGRSEGSAASGFDPDVSEQPTEDTAPPSAASRAAADEAPRSEARRSRPGLGTVWGEDVPSRIRHTSFQRAEPARPFATATLFYNDHAGIRAMARQSELSNHGDGGFSSLAGAVTVRLLDAKGRPLPAFEVASRNYVVGEQGQHYLIEVSNQTAERLEVVATVDGLDVVDGDEGSIRKRGYVVGSFDTLQIEGYRRTENTVAAFRFGRVADSYAAKTGKPRNVGVIGVAVFHERGSELPWTSDEVQFRHTAEPFPARFAAPPPR